MNQNSEKRPRVAAEVRAWVLAAVVLLGYGFAMTWWAATLSAQVAALRDTMGDIKAILGTAYSVTDARRDLSAIEAKLQDHEQRLRAGRL